MTEFAQLLADAPGKPIVYSDLPEDEYRNVPEGAGLPATLAAMLSDSSAASATDTLFDEGRTLSKLIGRPTLLIEESVAQAVRELPAA